MSLLYKVHYWRRDYFKIGKQFDDGEAAYLYEQRIMTRFKAYKYEGPDVLNGGNSELFTAKEFPSA